jgi:hypothetical protein
MQVWDLIVVGAGVAGAAFAYQQGVDGRRVLLLERDLRCACGRCAFATWVVVVLVMGLVLVACGGWLVAQAWCLIIYMHSMVHFSQASSGGSCTHTHAEPPIHACLHASMHTSLLRVLRAYPPPNLPPSPLPPPHTSTPPSMPCSQPDRIVGELLQPGGYMILKRMGLEACVNGIDAQKVYGYCMFKGEGEAKVAYPLEGV